ncbi:MAG TPA: hypothetical protein VN668_06300 [Stellaceae bacterium]|nr:hypothetical protein [Stellaceae bacterium]
MKVIEEPITVIREEERLELTVLMGGYRLALTIDEARALIGTVGTALEHLSPTRDKAVAPPAAGADPLAIAAKVKEQVISWAKITSSIEQR